MSGEELYQVYAAYHLTEHNCSMDPWEALDPSERAAWEAVAKATRDWHG